jgi:hypothetical protein
MSDCVKVLQALQTRAMESLARDRLRIEEYKREEQEFEVKESNKLPPTNFSVMLSFHSFSVRLLTIKEEEIFVVTSVDEDAVAKGVIPGLVLERVDGVALGRNQVRCSSFKVFMFEPW